MTWKMRITWKMRMRWNNGVVGDKEFEKVWKEEEWVRDDLVLCVDGWK